MGQARKYSPEFREEAARMAIGSPQPIAHVARELDVNPETLRGWVRNHERDNGSQAPDLDLNDRARLRELEKRNRQLEMENTFLKKAAAYFAKDHQ